MGSNKSSPDHRLSLNLATAPDSGFSSLPPSTVSCHWSCDHNTRL